MTANTAPAPGLFTPEMRDQLERGVDDIDFVAADAVRALLAAYDALRQAPASTACGTQAQCPHPEQCEIEGLCLRSAERRGEEGTDQSKGGDASEGLGWPRAKVSDVAAGERASAQTRAGAAARAALVDDYDMWNGCFPGNINVGYWMKRALAQIVADGERIADADKDYADMRRMQANFMAADHRRIELERELADWKPRGDGDWTDLEWTRNQLCMTQQYAEDRDAELARLRSQTFVTEEVARAAAKSYRVVPVTAYEIPELRQLRLPQPGSVDDHDPDPGDDSPDEWDRVR